MLDIAPTTSFVLVKPFVWHVMLFREESHIIFPIYFAICGVARSKERQQQPQTRITMQMGNADLIISRTRVFSTSILFASAIFCFLPVFFFRRWLTITKFSILCAFYFCSQMKCVLKKYTPYD